MMKNIFAEQQLRQGEFWIAFPNVSHPVAAWPANHPNYFLLGFIAALAPKFHPAGCLERPGEPRRAQRTQGAQAAQGSPGDARSPGESRSSQESPGEPFEVPNV